MALFASGLLLTFIGAGIASTTPGGGSGSGGGRGADKIAELFSEIENDGVHKDQSDIINNDYNSVMCWMETINSVVYKNGTRNDDRQFSTVFETPGDLTEESLKDEFGDTRRSKTVHYNSTFDTPHFSVQVNKSLTCGVGKIIIKEFKALPKGKKKIQIDLGSSKMLENYEFKKCVNISRCKTSKQPNKFDPFKNRNVSGHNGSITTTDQVFGPYKIHLEPNSVSSNRIPSYDQRIPVQNNAGYPKPPQNTNGLIPPQNRRIPSLNNGIPAQNNNAIRPRDYTNYGIPLENNHSNKTPVDVYKPIRNNGKGNILAPENNGIPSKDNVSPPQNNGRSSQDNPPPQTNGIPVENYRLHNNGIPSHEYRLPPHNYHMPSYDNRSPPQNYVTPPQNNGIPTKDNTIPTQSNGIPSHDNIIPPQNNGNKLPPKNNGMSSPDNPKSSHDNGISTPGTRLFPQSPSEDYKSPLNSNNNMITPNNYIIPTQQNNPQVYGIPPPNYYIVPVANYRPNAAQGNSSYSLPTPRNNRTSNPFETNRVSMIPPEAVNPLESLLKQPCKFRHKLNVTFQISINHIVTKVNSTIPIKITLLLNAVKTQAFNITQRNLQRINKPNVDDVNKTWERLVRMLSRQYFLDCCNKIVPFSEMPLKRTEVGISDEEALVLFDEESRAAMAAVHKQMQKCNGSN